MRFRTLIVALLAVCLSVLTACSEGPSASTAPLTYADIRGTGLANNCPTLEETSRGSIPLESGQTYFLSDLCLQPISFFVKEEPLNKREEAQYVPGKLLTRYTSTLTSIQGPLKPSSDGSLTFFEQDGIDFQAITVQLPSGEQVPFMFTIKNLVAKSQPGLDGINTSTDLKGSYKVPSYRSASFLDPKGRGEATGFDSAVAILANADNEEFTRANVKRAEQGQGKIKMQVSKVDNTTGEIAGIFESEQSSDTDLGAKDAVEVKIRGVFYGRIDKAS